MGQLTIGAVVLVNFPFGDLKGYKRRPALVLASSSLDSMVLCQITGHQLADVPVIPLATNDFSEGGLPISSFIRPDKLFTVDARTAKKSILGQITPAKLAETKAAVRQLFV